mmetsp:Transcript_27684/g.81362  ORF Transcript_27684/g.81362 Transcript_27684/m.81362 type:complete len:397 (-) Transcript_27684:269-1459(-)
MLVPLRLHGQGRLVRRKDSRLDEPRDGIPPPEAEHPERLLLRQRPVPRVHVAPGHEGLGADLQVGPEEGERALGPPRRFDEVPQHGVTGEAVDAGEVLLGKVEEAVEVFLARFGFDPDELRVVHDVVVGHVGEVFVGLLETGVGIHAHNCLESLYSRVVPNSRHPKPNHLIVSPRLPLRHLELRPLVEVVRVEPVGEFREVHLREGDGTVRAAHHGQNLLLGQVSLVEHQDRARGEIPVLVALQEGEGVEGRLYVRHVLVRRRDKEAHGGPAVRVRRPRQGGLLGRVGARLSGDVVVQQVVLLREGALDDEIGHEPLLRLAGAQRDGGAVRVGPRAGMGVCERVRHEESDGAREYRGEAPVRRDESSDGVARRGERRQSMQRKRVRVRSGSGWRPA